MEKLEQRLNGSVRFSENLILFVAGDKGGVGKSAFTKAFLDALDQAGIPYKLLEADRGIQDVAKHVGEETIYDLNSETGFRELFKALTSAPAGKVIVVSTPAGLIERALNHSPAFLDVFPELPTMLKRPVRVAWVIDEKRDVVEKLKQFREAAGDPVIDVVKNEFFCKEGSFTIFDGSEEKKRIENNNGQILIFPKLNPHVMSIVTNKRLNTSKAMEKLELYDRAFYSRWWDKVYASFQAAGYVP